MITAQQAVNLAADIYNPQPGRFDRVPSQNNVTVGLATIGNTLCIAHEGTNDVATALLDVLGIPFHHPQLGTLHAGFWHGMGDMYVLLRPSLRDAVRAGKTIAITGHSLGCPRGSILAGLCALDGIPVDQLFLFAPPRPGYQAIRDIVQKHVPMIKAYRNGPDPVPLQFPAIPLFPWCDIADLEILNSPPEGWLDEHDPLEWHHILLYQAGLGRGASQTS